MERAGHVLLFQYGSNMSMARMRNEKERLPVAEPVEEAWTVDTYDFCFPVRSKKYDRAVSGIVPNKNGRNIFGALYAIPADRMERDPSDPAKITMDRIEGEGINYRRATIRVTGVESRGRST